jgi:hypothetical protein
LACGRPIRRTEGAQEAITTALPVWELVVNAPAIIPVGDWALVGRLAKGVTGIRVGVTC